MDCDSQREICKKCGAYCCSLGGTAATSEERARVLNAGHPDHFIKMSDDCYVTAWGEDGICPYLEGTSCTIYKVRPIVCQKFPVVTFDNREHFLAHCPLMDHQLTAEDLERLVHLSSRVSEELMQGAMKYLKPYQALIEKRIQRFEMEKIVRII